MSRSRLVAALCAGLILVMAVASGLGALDLLRNAGALGVGPAIRGALPLQQLAGDEAQPLLRLVVAWLPAGAVAGLALRRVTRLRVATGIGVVLVVSVIVLVGSAAVSDAVARSGPVAPHLLPRLGAAATWIATASLALGALAAWRRS